MTAYYNEIDPYAAQWLRNLINAGHIAPGVVDERSIVDIRPDELTGFTQCHFFAGIGGWSYALRLAGWPDDRPAWTGSCPCQPFSAAGKGAGFADERHLWPSWYWLISQSRPAVIFGEQVAAKAVEPWIDLVQADMEALGYAFSGIPFPAASVGAPHIRDRLSFVADARHSPGRQNASERHNLAREHSVLAERAEAASLPGADSLMADANPERRNRQHALLRQENDRWQPATDILEIAGSGIVDELGDTNNAGSQGRIVGRDSADQWPIGQASVDGFWADAEWLPCRDGKARPVKPGIFPLAHGVPARVGKLRGAGNAIVPQAQAEFIGAYLDRTALEETGNG